MRACVPLRLGTNQRETALRALRLHLAGALAANRYIITLAMKLKQPPEFFGLIL